ncbi:MAG: glycosyltransferase family 2 protein [Minisyncoccales bacterium]
MPENQCFITAIVVCRNEECFIAKCLDSIIANDYPKNKLEVFVVDGMSEDKTRQIVREYTQKYPYIVLLDNPKKFTPFAFNIGIRRAQGDFIAIMGAHSTYENRYFSKCCRYIREHNADNVGGMWRVTPQAKGVMNKAIAASLSSAFGTGNAHYKTYSDNKPKEVDTVFGGFYRKDVFARVGYFNEDLARTQDIEFNIRLKKAGGKILLFPNIEVIYYPKANLRDFFIHNFRSGEWIIYSYKLTKRPLKLRHYLPFVAVSVGIVIVAVGFFFPPAFLFLGLVAVLYLAMSLYFSTRLAAREKDWRLFFLAPVVFAARQFAYGIGSVAGVAKLITK